MSLLFELKKHIIKPILKTISILQDLILEYFASTFFVLKIRENDFIILFFIFITKFNKKNLTLIKNLNLNFNQVHS